jgi:quercetin dioxygenase-like cupin family protein
MRINDELSKPVLVHAAKMDWVASPSAGVDRRMLFRIGDEVARATSVVRYARGSAFPRHTHGGGEEFLVLEGVFQDEHGDYPAGTYLRNPPGTSHVPASKEGCTIFVRLWQFRKGDQVQIAHQQGQGQPVAPRAGAIKATVLFDDGHEEVRLEDWQPGETIKVANARGLEFFVVSGSVKIGSEVLEAQGWGRLPAGAELNATVGPQGARIWMKAAPLLHPDVCRLPGSG